MKWVDIREEQKLVPSNQKWLDKLWVNSGESKANAMTIVSQAEATASEGAETTGGI